MEQTKENQLQHDFINTMQNLLPENLSLVDVLSDVLQISNDSVYRRIRGDTMLDIEEVAKLCEHFQISFDNFIKIQSNSVTFNFLSLEPTIESFKDYLKNMLENFKRISALPEKEIIYAADDIPVFILFEFNELAAFKMFYWMKSVLDIPEFTGTKFDFSVVDEEIMATGKEMLDNYTKIPSTEIWNEHTVISLCKQIEFYRDTELFVNREVALKICDDLLGLMNLKKRKAESSGGTGDHAAHKFNLYYSDVEIGNNCIYLKLKDSSYVYLSFNTLNNLATSSGYFCNESYKWLKNLIKKSVLISGVSEKQRFQFFNRLEDIIIATRKKIDS